jgi:hypothetical protein
MSFKVRIANLEARLHPRPDPSRRAALSLWARRRVRTQEHWARGAEVRDCGRMESTGASLLCQKGRVTIWRNPLTPD